MLNDQFRGAAAWEEYLRALEVATPPIRAVGVTDYYSLDNYERVTTFKQNGRLSDCDLIFPNIEARLDLGTTKSWVNIHFLVSPDDDEHVTEIRRFLARLTFEAHGDTYSCQADDLIRLGTMTDPAVTNNDSALQLGSEQFKVSFQQLRAEYRRSKWAQGNVVIAVAAGSNDGTSGVKSSADQTLRQEVERFAHVMFSSNPRDREFWLGRGSMPLAALRDRYGNAKPCLHGSDAHELRTVGVPDHDRYSWIKGTVSFDSLRQACIDPANRAYVGSAAPTAAQPSQVISKVVVTGAPWLQTPEIELNSGLVAIIGARGSGKTALADIIAAGSDAAGENLNKQSFVYRAREHLFNAEVELEWATGETEVRDLAESGSTRDLYARARYLSQQFVEDLCASDGMTDALLREIQRVIFESQSVNERDGATDFDELLEFRAGRYRQSAQRQQAILTALSDEIGTELEKESLLPAIRREVEELTKSIHRHTQDRSRLVAKGSEERAARLAQLAEAAESARSKIRALNAREASLLALHDEVREIKDVRTPEALRVLRTRHRLSGLTDEEWAGFALMFKTDVNKTIEERLNLTRRAIQSLTGKPPIADEALSSTIESLADLTHTPLADLEAEIARLERLINLDKQIRDRFTAISKRIAEETSALSRLTEKYADYEKARERAGVLNAQRQSAYQAAFTALANEEQVLKELYAPLLTRLENGSGSIQKLSFSVRRVADIFGWAEDGEALLDLRRQGPFKGRGTLQQRAEEMLRGPWESGDPELVAGSLAAFQREYRNALLEHAPVSRENMHEYRAWTKRFAQWLYSTSHVHVEYSIEYDGIDIRKLSPGTRGIVLLLLYLALDVADDRPLLIDQPEENLDPKSVFDELVGLFVQAKEKRQVIIVTHNSNLVVNTDADQIIVATAGIQVEGALPQISYSSGGLEDAHIREQVCAILEGGETAFRERARRLRVTLQR